MVVDDRLFVHACGTMHLILFYTQVLSAHQREKNLWNAGGSSWNKRSRVVRCTRVRSHLQVVALSQSSSKLSYRPSNISPLCPSGLRNREPYQDPLDRKMAVAWSCSLRVVRSPPTCPLTVSHHLRAQLHGLRTPASENLCSNIAYGHPRPTEAQRTHDRVRTRHRGHPSTHGFLYRLPCNGPH